MNLPQHFQAVAAPDRAGDGYGLSESTVRALAARGTRLLLTADCAITAVRETALARQLGMDVVVSDHHAPRADGALPEVPIVHPAVCGYPCPELCAAAVAYKLASAVLEASGRPQQELEEDLDLVALATIADVVPLRGENRSLARRGLRALARTRKPGLRALMAVARVEPAVVEFEGGAVATYRASMASTGVPRLDSSHVTRPTTGLPMRRARAISESVPNSPATAMRTSAARTTRALRASPMPVAMATST